MSSNEPIFLKPGMTVRLEGVEMSFEDIKNCKIDSVLYRKHLKKLMNKR